MRPVTDLRIATWPAGMDPDEVLRRDPKEYELVMATAENYIDFKIRTLSQGRDIHSAKVKQELADLILPDIDRLE